MIKKCIRCKKEKDICSFYKHKGMADGYLNVCIECKKKYSISYRIKNIEYIKEYDRNRPNRIERNKQFSLKRALLKEKEPELYKKQKKESIIRFRMKYPEKIKAHDRVSYAIKNGILKRAPFCQMCKAEARCEAHHEDYTKPLDVLWLCDNCHKKRHKEIRKEQRERKVIKEK